MTTMYNPNRPGYDAGPPRIRFEAISEAWQLFQQQMGTWILAVLVFSVFLSIVGSVCYALFFGALMAAFAGLSASSRNGEQPSDGASLAAVLGFFAFFVLMMVTIAVLGAFFRGGLYRMALKQVRNEPIAVGDLFSAPERAPALIGSSLLEAVVANLLHFTMIGPYLVMGNWMLSGLVILDKRVGAIEGMRLSWNAVKRDMLTAAALYFVLILLMSAGVCFCLVGGLFTIPLYFLTSAIVYRDLFLTEEFRGPQITMPLPPQSPSAQSLDV